MQNGSNQLSEIIFFGKKNERGGVKKLQQFEASMISLENVKTEKYFFALCFSHQPFLCCGIFVRHILPDLRNWDRKNSMFINAPNFNHCCMLSSNWCQRFAKVLHFFSLLSLRVLWSTTKQCPTAIGWGLNWNSIFQHCKPFALRSRFGFDKNLKKRAF